MNKDTQKGIVTGVTLMIVAVIINFSDIIYVIGTAFGILGAMLTTSNIYKWKYGKENIEISRPKRIIVVDQITSMLPFSVKK